LAEPCLFTPSPRARHQQYHQRFAIQFRSNALIQPVGFEITKFTIFIEGDLKMTSDNAEAIRQLQLLQHAKTPAILALSETIAHNDAQFGQKRSSDISSDGLDNSSVTPASLEAELAHQKVQIPRKSCAKPELTYSRNTSPSSDLVISSKLPKKNSSMQSPVTRLCW